MVTLLLIGIGVLMIALLHELVQEWRREQSARAERLLNESWEMYRASRRLHDQTAAALESMFDAARKVRAPYGGHDAD
jgi:Tfp pilus assembly protein PilV